MKLTIGVKLFIAYFAITSGIVWFVTDKISMRVVKGIDQAAEEVMIDSSNLLAQMATQTIEQDQINVEKIHRLISAYLNRELDASIYSVLRKTLTCRSTLLIKTVLLFTILQAN